MYIVYIIVSVTLTKRNGYSNGNVKPDLKDTLTSELKRNFKMKNLKGALRYKSKNNINSEL